MKNNIAIRRTFDILLSVSILITGICLMAGCLSIYSIGDQPYSREIVIETFAKISLPVYISISLVIIGFIIEFFSPSKSKKIKSSLPYSYILSRLKSKKNFENGEIEIIKSIQKEQKSRKTHLIIRTILICISIITFLSYALNADNYQTDINSSVIKAMGLLTPCFLIPAIYSVIVAYYNEKSFKKEIELVKELQNKEKAEKYEFKNDEKFITIIRFVIMFIGIGFLFCGYFAGGTADVLTKAINICTECIGLG